jgi:serine/threonine protein kinase
MVCKPPSSSLSPPPSPQVDWWSFGCFVHELLTGTSPFRTERAKNLLPHDERESMDLATLEIDIEFDPEVFGSYGGSYGSSGVHTSSGLYTSGTGSVGVTSMMSVSRLPSCGEECREEEGESGGVEGKIKKGVERKEQNGKSENNGKGGKEYKEMVDCVQAEEGLDVIGEATKGDGGDKARDEGGDEPSPLSAVCLLQQLLVREPSLRLGSRRSSRTGRIAPPRRSGKNSQKAVFVGSTVNGGSKGGCSECNGTTSLIRGCSQCGGSGGDGKCNADDDAVTDDAEGSDWESDSADVWVGIEGGGVLAAWAGAEDVQQHGWFSCIDWEALKAGTMQAPFVPTTSRCSSTPSTHVILHL